MLGEGSIHVLFLKVGSMQVHFIFGNNAELCAALLIQGQGMCYKGVKTEL